MTPAAERMIYTRGYQNGYKAIRRAGKEQREQRIEELENENVGVKEQRDVAEARVERLYALLVEWADEVHIHTDEPCDVGPSCLMCRTAAALKATP